jgi:hypothetical protein
MDEDKAAYVMAEMEGPFGALTQISARMRLSEAAATAADLASYVDQSGSRKTKRVWIKNVRVVRLTDDTA